MSKESRNRPKYIPGTLCQHPRCTRLADYVQDGIKCCWFHTHEYAEEQSKSATEGALKLAMLSAAIGGRHRL